MPDDFQYDVFLSHSSKDKPTVRDLAERLRSDGLRVWFDEWDIRLGDSIPKKIDEGLKQSRFIIICVSAHGIGSDWVQMETYTFRFSDPLNKNRRFIPLRLDDTPVDGSLAQFSSLDWRPEKREECYATLLGACRAHEPHVAPNGADAIVGPALPDSRPAPPLAAYPILNHSPFHPRGPMPLGERSYVVRTCEAELRKAIEANDFVWLRGSFQFGKTSLLRRHASWLGAGWVPLRPDLELFNHSTDERFLRDFFDEIDEATREWRHTAPARRRFDWLALKVFVQSRKVVFLLDEIGTCRYTQVKLVIENLYSIAEKAPGNVKLVVCFMESPALFLQDCGIQNPKYTDAWRIVELGPLTPDEVRWLINLFPDELSSPLLTKLERLRALTEFKPQSVQYLLNDLWESCKTSSWTGPAEIFIDQWLDAKRNQ